MKAIAFQSRSDSGPARKQQKAEVHAAPVWPWSIQPASAIDGAVIQRKSTCACGGGCPACKNDEDDLPVQTKAAISTPGDPFEQEADRVAEEVFRMPEPQALPGAPPARPCPIATVKGACPEGEGELQRQAIEEEEEQATPQTKRSPEQATALGTEPTVPSTLQHRITALQGGVTSAVGQSLPGEIRLFFENRMGYNLEGVRIHTDGQAARLADNLNAMAFTVGRDIHFGRDQFDPASLTGRYLLAHELAHVVQQTGPPRAYRQPGPGLLPGVFSHSHPGWMQTGSPRISRTQDGEEIQCAFPWLIAAAVAALAAGGYAWWAYNCLAPVKIPMYITTFGADYATRRSGGFRRWHFDRTGQPLPSRLWDAFGHCYVACASTRKCGATTTAIAGEGRELYREYIDAAPHDSYTQDTNNQALGRSFGNAGADCEQASRDAALAGRLDLTAPLVDYWTPTRGEYPATAEERRNDQARLAAEARQRQQRELEARLRAAYQTCLSRELERPGGVPTEAEEVAARETCRRETGYPH